MERREFACVALLHNAQRKEDGASGDCAEDDGAEPLNFSSIPWPTFTKPSGLRSITPEAVSSFLLSPNHSTSQSPRERIKKALRRWHPDKFDRVLKHVVPDERALVEEGAGVVSRILSQLLNRV